MNKRKKIQFFLSGKGGSPAPERLYGLFFDGVNDFMEKPPTASIADREVRLKSTFPSNIGRDQQIISYSPSPNTGKYLAATYFSTRFGSVDFIVGAGFLSFSESWSIASGASITGEIQDILINIDINSQISEASINESILTNPADAETRVDEIPQYRLGVRDDGNFPYRGVIIEWRDGNTVFNDGNDWGDFTINGAQRVYTDNSDAPQPSWFFTSNDQPVTL